MSENQKKIIGLMTIVGFLLSICFGHSQTTIIFAAIVGTLFVYSESNRGSFFIRVIIALGIAFWIMGTIGFFSFHSEFDAIDQMPAISVLIESHLFFLFLLLVLGGIYGIFWGIVCIFHLYDILQEEIHFQNIAAHPFYSLWHSAVFLCSLGCMFYCCWAVSAIYAVAPTIVLDEIVFTIWSWGGFHLLYTGNVLREKFLSDL